MPWCWCCVMPERPVNKLRRRLLRQFTAALRNCRTREQEQALQQAYDLGRDAIARGLGVLDMAKLHQEALVATLRSTLQSGAIPCVKAAGALVLEALTPFEATHRGFHEAYLKLRELNSALEQRNLEQAAINRHLRREIKERKRTEAALRQSEKHYRKLFRQAQLMQEDLRHLSNQILHVQEEERTRISRELHDEVGQALTAINVNLAMLTKQPGQPQSSLEGRIASVQALLEQTMNTVHNFARELRPAMLDELGLLPALRSYLKGFQERTRIRTSFKAGPHIEELDDGQKTALFRVAQESLTNITKHAQASEVAIAICRRNGSVRMEISDNGKGFAMEPQMAAKRKKRLGLLGMQERVRLVNGRLGLRSQPGKGTVVSVLIPLKSRPAVAVPARSVRRRLRPKHGQSTVNPRNTYAKNHRIARR